MTGDDEVISSAGWPMHVVILKRSNAQQKDPRLHFLDLESRTPIPLRVCR
jgi:hypothetical protein